ncbi:HAMP domain-containing protein [bacterium]|nr:HAMP domain-containing protein [bacterium]
MRRLNIRWRLTLWFGAAMILLLLIRSFWIYFIMDWRTTLHTDSQLNLDISAISTQLRTADDRSQLVQALNQYVMRHAAAEVKVKGPDNSVIFSYAPGQDVRSPSSTKEPQGHEKWAHFTTETPNGRRRAVSGQVPSSIGNLSIELSLSTQDRRDEVLSFALTLFTTLPFVFAAALGVGYFVSSRALTPVDKMISDAQRITGLQLNQRIAVPESRDELARLARTLNEMINRLHQSFEDMRRFTADAAHDLRTPVTALRTAVEVSLMADHTTEEYQASLHTILDEAIHLSQLTSQLLDLSREDHGAKSGVSEPVRLDELIAIATADLQLAAQKKGIAVETVQMPPLLVSGDPIRLRRVFMNLLDNALQYTPCGGNVQIKGGPLGDGALITIIDNGPGIPEDELPHIFDRFRRVDKSRTRQGGGTGLGLAICKAIVEAHGGRIHMDSAIGYGTRVSVELPGYQADASKELPSDND